MTKLVNLACGTSYINNSDWINLDFNSESKNVITTNIIDSIPLNKENVDFVYSSHFIEHLNKDDLNKVLNHIYKILKPGGILRISTPNFQYLAKEYLNLIEAKKVDKNFKNKIRFIKLIIFDQIFRSKSGGELKKFYQVIKTDLIQYCEDLCGTFKRGQRPMKIDPLNKLKCFTFKKFIYKLRILFALIILPKSFKKNNVSMAQTGELHKWLYDYFDLKDILIQKGFLDIKQKKVGETNSLYVNYIRKLEVINKNKDRKGVSNLIIECRK